MTKQWFGGKHPFFPNLSFGEVHERSLIMDKQLRDHGKLTVIYQCEMEKQLSANQQMQEFFHNYDTCKKEPLEPRYVSFNLHDQII